MKITRSKLRRIIREEANKMNGSRSKLSEQTSRRQLDDMLDKAINFLDRAYIQGTNDAMQMVGSGVEGMSDRDVQQLSRKLKSIGEKIVQLQDEVYSLQKSL